MIDIVELQDHYNGREELIRRTFRLFLEDADRTLKRCGKALDAGETEEAAKAAHSLANLCGVVRSSAAVDRARELQKNLSEKGGDAAAARCRFNELLRDIEDIKRFIADYGDET